MSKTFFVQSGNTGFVFKNLGQYIVGETKTTQKEVLALKSGQFLQLHIKGTMKINFPEGEFILPSGRWLVTCAEEYRSILATN